MAALLIGLAASLAAPDLSDLDALALGRVFADAHVGTDTGLEFEITVSPSGKPLACTILRSVGSDVAVKAVCPQLMQRKFSLPAKVDGQPAYGKFHDMLAATIRRGPDMMEVIPDLALDVAELPGSKRKMLDVFIVARVDADGHISDCQGGRNADARYAKVACLQAQAEVWGKVMDEQGAPVPYVTTLDVRFNVQGKANEGSKK